jgi:hypothetical protein
MYEKNIKYGDTNWPEQVSGGLQCPAHKFQTLKTLKTVICSVCVSKPHLN